MRAARLFSPRPRLFDHHRDYDREERGKGFVKAYSVRDVGDTRYVVIQVWDFDGDHYDLTICFVE